MLINIISSVTLTNDSEIKCLGYLWFGGDLALVDARVPGLWRGDLEEPIRGALCVKCSEPLVASVGIQASREHVGVALPHPRHLREEWGREVVCVWGRVGLGGSVCVTKNSLIRSSGVLCSTAL